MKRGLVLSLSALALTALGSAVQAQSTVDVSLNLRYNDPANPAEGGTWTLVAKTNSANGIAAVNAYINNIDTAGVAYGTGIAAELDDSPAGPFVTQLTGGVNVLYGQDTASGPVVMNVGRSNHANNIAVDPLHNTAWNNVTAIATGTFTGARPAFVTIGANSTDANTFATNSTTTPLAAGAVIDANTSTPVVRGDSIASLGLNSNPAAGLARGDANRDFKVDAADLNLVLFNFNDTVPAAGAWDKGDFDNNNKVDAADLNNVLFSFNDTSIAPVSAVPEPAALLLAVVGAGLACIARRGRANGMVS